ncbi:PTS fructose transporter subunit IIA [Melaminivora sp.]
MTTRLLLITHAPLAQALRECALHVFPDCAANLLTLDVPPDQAPEHTLAAARALCAQAGAGPLLVLTDLLGATPCNVAQRLVAGQEARLVAGVNLPMLLRTICYQAEPLEALVARALAGGTQGVMAVAAAADRSSPASAP